MNLADFLSVAGFFLAVLGIALTFVTFYAPALTLKLALSRPDQWKRILTPELNKYYFRNAYLSGFSIEIDWDAPVVENFYEAWLDTIPCPDTQHNASYNVSIHFNGFPIVTELFVSLDGGRWFLPVPKLKREPTGYRWYFTRTQKLISEIVGKDYLGQGLRPIFDQISDTVHPSNIEQILRENPNISINSIEHKLKKMKRET